jgi:hypothetical protein
MNRLEGTRQGWPVICRVEKPLLWHHFASFPGNTVNRVKRMLFASKKTPIKYSNSLSFNR